MKRHYQDRKKLPASKFVATSLRSKGRRPEVAAQRFLGGVFDNIDMITLQQTIGNAALQQVLSALGYGTGTGTPGQVPGQTAGGGPGASIVNHAQSHVGDIDYSQRPNNEPKGWRLLGEIFEKGANKKFSDAILKSTWRPGNIDWCGIFGAYCWQKAGVNVTWLQRAGPKGSVKKVWPKKGGSRKVFEASIKPGDIAAIPERNHHFIVVSTDPTSGKIESVDGNQTWGAITAESGHKLSEVVAYYTPT